MSGAASIRTTPWSYHRLKTLFLHDAQIESAIVCNDTLEMRIVRESCPWAPGPVGVFSLVFGGLLDASIWEDSGRRVSPRDRSLGGSVWLDANALCMGGDTNMHLRYEVETTEGLLQLACRSVRLESNCSFVDANNFGFAELEGHRLKSVRRSTNSPDVWFEFSKFPGNSPLVIGVNCDFHLLSGHGAVPLSHWSCIYSAVDTYDDEPQGDENPGDVRACAAMVEQRAVVSSAKVDANGCEIGFCAPETGSTLSQWMLRIGFAEDAMFPDAGCTDWWAIHRGAQSAVLTPLSAEKKGNP